uniref:Uncharacterized protein n=1 Tax=Physcomitrium patens TaxID=3218 RepID=A0A2K1L8H8_PHYPA|nr:hypothetical protein PHYPA_000769 [Physcomitrium patens]
MPVKTSSSVTCSLNRVGVEFIKLTIVRAASAHKKVDSFPSINIESVVFTTDLYLRSTTPFCWRLRAVDKSRSIPWKLRYAVNLLFMNSPPLSKRSLSSFWSAYPQIMLYMAEKQHQNVVCP